ncbi:MAG: mechanosensitive ion channel family protein [Thiomicrospira sp.]
MLEGLDMSKEAQLLLENYVIPWGINIAIALLVLFIGFWVIARINRVLGSILSQFKLQQILIDFIQQVARVALYILLIIGVLSQLGFDTTSLVAMLAAGSLAVGFALRDTLANFAAGVVMIVLQPFKTGDFVEAGGITGVVEKVNLFNTLLRTTDNREITVPNGQISRSALINYSARDTRRIDLVIGIHYDSDLRKAKQVLMDLIKSEPRALAEPEPLVAVSELADNSVNFTVRMWVNNEDYWAVRFDFIERVKLTFDEQGIVIPFPQMDVHIQQPAQAS